MLQDWPTEPSSIQGINRYGCNATGLTDWTKRYIKQFHCHLTHRKGSFASCVTLSNGQMTTLQFTIAPSWLVQAKLYSYFCWNFHSSFFKVSNLHVYYINYTPSTQLFCLYSLFWLPVSVNFWPSVRPFLLNFSKTWNAKILQMFELVGGHFHIHILTL